MVIDGAKTGHHNIADGIRPLMQSANVDRSYYCHWFVPHFDNNKDKIRALSAAAIVDHRHRLGHKTLAQRKKSGDFIIKWQSAWGISGERYLNGNEKTEGLAC